MWIAIMLATALEDSISEDDPGEVMLWLMKHLPEDVQRGYLDWLRMRDKRGETAVRALFDPAIASALKEEYLHCVATCAKEVGFYNILYSDFSIRTDETEGEE